MTMSGGKRTPIWTGGAVALVLLAIFVPRLFRVVQGGEVDSVQVTDSAGVQIVESTGPAWREGEGWRVGGMPILRVGVVDGDPAYQFAGITGLARLDDGTVVVADEGSQEVRFFSPEGEVRSVVGGRGGGPGEFTGLAGLGWNPPGGVWAYDFSLRRVTWLNPAGEVTTITSLTSEPPVLNAMGALSDGTFVLKQLWGYGSVAEARQPGLRRDPVAVVRFDSAGVLLDTLGLFPGREVYLFEENGRGVMSTPPFARNATGAVRRDRIVLGDQEEYSLSEFDAEGRLRRVMRIPDRVRSAEAQDLEAYIQGRLVGAPPEEHPAIRQSLEEMPHPATLPAYGSLLGDRAGNLWVAEWTTGSQEASVWNVFDAGGRWLGPVRLPEGFQPWDAGDDWILGAVRDELDVEYVVLYSLQKG